MPWIVFFSSSGSAPEEATKAAEDAEALARVGLINVKEEEALLKFLVSECDDKGRG